MKSLGHYIRQLRDRPGLTQSEAAERLGITNVYLNYLEHDKKRPSLDLLDKFHAVMGENPYVSW
jgi:transcriptional regulator with XRE-family HTH domain